MQSQTQTASQSTVEGEVSPEHLVLDREYVRINVDGPRQYRSRPSKFLGRPTQNTVKFDAGDGATVTANVNAFRYFEPSAAPQEPPVYCAVSRNVRENVSPQLLAQYDALRLRAQCSSQQLLIQEQIGRVIERINMELGERRFE